MLLFFYRKWKNEQEIEGLLWKINQDCLQGYYRGLHNYTSHQSLISEKSHYSENSLMNIASTQCVTARYRGSKVKVKELFYERRKDIPRDMMKEMKIMRELRHDNINR